jgi:hypothetical protein
MLPVTPAAHLQDRFFAAGAVNRSESGANNSGISMVHTFIRSHASRRDIEIRFSRVGERRAKLAKRDPPMPVRACALHEP